MKTVIAGLALVIGLTACETRRGQDTGRVGESADTSIIPRTTQDTLIVESDTTVDVDTDTTLREGDARPDTGGSR